MSDLVCVRDELTETASQVPGVPHPTRSLGPGGSFLFHLLRSSVLTVAYQESLPPLHLGSGL